MTDGGWELSWAGELRQQVDAAKVQLAATFANVSHGRRKVSHQLERTAAKLGAAADLRAKATVSGEIHQRVMDAFARSDMSGLTVREQRYAAAQIEQVPAAAMRSFLASYPSNWSAFVAACMQRWEAFMTLRERQSYVRLLAAAPRSIGFLHLTGRPQELLDSDGVTVVAGQLSSSHVGDAMEELERLGFKPSWQYTAIVLAMWVRMQVKRRRLSFLGLWQAVRHERVVEAMLLPPLRASRNSWFATEARPARVRGAASAYAIFITTLLLVAREEGRGSAAEERWAELTEKLFASTMGDPRIPPESDIWRYAMRFDEESCRFLLERLFTEELSIFFEHAMSEQRRQRFWLRYVRSVRRTICILDRGTHERLTQKLASADKQLAAALARARKFSSGGEAGKGVQAFCLYFDRHVVVEFSETGNAAYIYERARFEEKLQQAIEQDRCSSHSQLKQPKLNIGRIIHSDRWEEQAAQMLSGLGIHAG